ncbi:MAG: hypothetical protein FJ292_05375 [Planctomycetes bacterium]|nr:hypothetical protein [Planctomycetota bacterium]
MLSSRHLALALGALTFAACDRSPTAPPPHAAGGQSPGGGRTSLPGQLMDRAEDVQKQAEAYNQAIQDTIDQGTAPSPRPKPAGQPQPPR